MMKKIAAGVMGVTLMVTVSGCDEVSVPIPDTSSPVSSTRSVSPSTSTSTPPSGSDAIVTTQHTPSRGPAPASTGNSRGHRQVKEELPPTKEEALRGTIVPMPVSTDANLGNRNDAVFYTVTGPAKVEKQLAPQEVQYGELDRLGRSTGVYAMVTVDMFNHSAGARLKRESGPEPSGYKGNNAKAEITSIVDGNPVTYKGYFYNRSHLLGDLLGGRFFVNNLVTGTRMQNVGWNHAKKTPDGGMQYTENLARRHFEQLNKRNEGRDDKHKEQCDVYYAAVPNYTGDDLVPKTVTVDIQNCDKSIDQHVIVYNTAPGYVVRYSDGSFFKDTMRS